MSFLRSIPQRIATVISIIGCLCTANIATALELDSQIKNLWEFFPSFQGENGIVAQSRDVGTSNYRTLSGSGTFYGTPGAPFQIPSVFRKNATGIECHPSQILQGGSNRDAVLRVRIDLPDVDPGVAVKVRIRGATGRGDTSPSVTWYIYSGASNWNAPIFTTSSLFQEFDLEVMVENGEELFFATNAGSSDTNDNATFEGVTIQRVMPEATFIIIPIHGQRPDLLPPAWLGDIGSKTESLEMEINTLRDADDIPPIEAMAVLGDWASRTADGLPSILASRVMYLVWEFNELQSIPPSTLQQAALFALAGHTEGWGRESTAAASRAAARQIANRVGQAVQETRERTDEMHPIFVDIIGYSRGGAVSSEVLRLLETQLFSDPFTEVTWTLLDGIDPTPDGMLERPRALAGNLLGDPAITSQPAVGSTANFFADVALLTGQAGVYGGDLLTQIELLFGPQTDAWLVERGYPLGRSRAEIGPAQDIRVLGTSHTSISETLAATFTGAQVGVVESSPGSLRQSTKIGEVVQQPLLRFDGTRNHEGFGAEIARNMVGDLFSAADTVATGCAYLDAASEVAGYQEFRDLVIPELGFVLSDIDSAVSTMFPASGPWRVVAGTPWLDCESATNADPAFVLDSNAVMAQELLPASVDSEVLIIELRVEWMRENANLVAEMAGPGLSQSRTFAAIDDGPVGVGTDLAFLVARSAGAGRGGYIDDITLAGDGVRILEARVTAGSCSGDLDLNGSVDGGDLGVFLGAWGAPDADLNGDGTTDGADLGVLLGAWGPCP